MMWLWEKKIMEMIMWEKWGDIFGLFFFFLKNVKLIKNILKGKSKCFLFINKQICKLNFSEKKINRKPIYIQSGYKIYPFYLYKMIEWITRFSIVQKDVGFNGVCFLLFRLGFFAFDQFAFAQSLLVCFNWKIKKN